MPSDLWDFRALSPFLFGAVLWLTLSNRRTLPALLFAGSFAMLVWFITLSPVGAFQDEYRFISPPVSPQITEACQAIAYHPNAENPFENTVRSDIISFQIMQELDPALGFQFGWFSPGSIGKSRWLLTDYLKTVVEDYESVHTTAGANVYRKIIRDIP